MTLIELKKWKCSLPSRNQPSAAEQLRCAKLKDCLFAHREHVARCLKLDAVFDTAASHCFISPEAARVANAEIYTYENPVQVRLAVAGSRASINRYAKLSFELDGEAHKWHFDVFPLKGKDAIVGMDFMREKEAILQCAPPQVTLGGRNALPPKVLEAVDEVESGRTPKDWPSEEEVAAFKAEMLAKYSAAFVSGDYTPVLPPKRGTRDSAKRPVISAEASGLSCG